MSKMKISDALVAATMGAAAAAKSEGWPNECVEKLQARIRHGIEGWLREFAVDGDSRLEITSGYSPFARHLVGTSVTLWFKDGGKQSRNFYHSLDSFADEKRT